MKNQKQKTSNKRGWTAAGFLVRLIPACLMFIGIFYIIAPFYIRFLLPVFAKEIEFLHPEFKVLKYDIIKLRKIDYLQFDIRVNKTIANDREGRKNRGDITRHRGQASSLCVAPIIIFSLILSWPSLSIRQRVQAFFLSVPLIVLIQCLDFPMIFIANIESVYSANVIANTIRKIWSQILDNGGRQFLSLIAFLLLIAPYYLKWEKAPAQSKTIAPAKPGRNAPCPCGSGKKYKNCCLKKN